MTSWSSQFKSMQKNKLYLRQPDEIPKQEYSQKSSSACQKNTSPVPATQVLEVSRPPKSSQHDVHTVQFKKQDKGKILRIKTPVWDVLGLDLDLPIWIPARQQLQSWTIVVKIRYKKLSWPYTQTTSLMYQHKQALLAGLFNSVCK